MLCKGTSSLAVDGTRTPITPFGALIALDAVRRCPYERRAADSAAAFDVEAMTVYYGIHDALRELGDPDHDAGDGQGLPREHVVSGLWDAGSALSRLRLHVRALEETLREIASYYAEQYREGDIGYQAVLIARAALAPQPPYDDVPGAGP